MLPFQVHVVTAGNIKDAILTRQNTTGGSFSAIPWYTKNTDGSESIGRRQCSSEYKITPIRRECRRLLGKDSRERIKAGAVELWIGISIDEAARMKPARQQWMTHRWPLIEGNISRAGCLKWLADHGYHEPPKSSCIGCPYKRDMRATSPDEFADAVAVDAAMRKDARPVAEYMHDARIPLAEAVERAAQDKRDQPDLFMNECEGICGV